MKIINVSLLIALLVMLDEYDIATEIECARGRWKIAREGV